MLIFNKNVNKKDLNFKLLRRLDMLEFYCITDLIITSGLRTAEYNKKIGGIKNSSHLKGLACDIAYKTSRELHTILISCLKAGFNRIGIGKGHVHVDIDTEKVNDVIWLENH